MLLISKSYVPNILLIVLCGVLLKKKQNKFDVLISKRYVPNILLIVLCGFNLQLRNTVLSVNILIMQRAHMFNQAWMSSDPKTTFNRVI
jgi:hypothetical protein